MKQVYAEWIALNMDQIEFYGPPPNPAKTTDARFIGYQAEYGDESWELDSLDLDTLNGLITEAILSYRDDAKFAARVQEEKAYRRDLKLASKFWDQAIEGLRYD